MSRCKEDKPFTLCHPELTNFLENLFSYKIVTLNSFQGLVVSASEPAPTQSLPHERGRKAAFTLAEVLITLGIIGVVAALTLPTLIQNYTNQVVETRLQKFYSVINQAVAMAETDFGDKKNWAGGISKVNPDTNEGLDATVEIKEWFDKYLKPYLNIAEIKTLEDGTFIAYFNDGSALGSKLHTNSDWYFYPGNAEKCLERYAGGNVTNLEKGLGICVFGFQFNPNDKSSIYKYNKGFEPYKYAWDGKLESLYNSSKASYTGCNETKRAYCTALIQYHGWKITKDYPLKVNY